MINSNDQQRQKIFANVGAALANTAGETGSDRPNSEQRIANAQNRLAETSSAGVTKSEQPLTEEKVKDFISRLEKQSATVARVTGPQAAPSAIADYLNANDLPAQIRCGSDPRFIEITKAPGTLTVKNGPAQADDPVGLSFAQAGISETGTLVLSSGPDNPVTLAFLPATHIVLLHGSDIVASYEEAIAKVRAVTNRDRSNHNLPRTVNFISGPSRTADIAGRLVTGAHGPKRLHVILLENIGS